MTQSHLFVVGAGYTGCAIALAAARCGWHVTATSRSPGDIQAMPGVELVDFGQAGPSLASATHLVSTVPPGRSEGDHAARQADPVLARYAPAIAAAPLRWLGYLSTIGVYGDRGGAWVDEATAPDPDSPRGRQRIQAEQAWQRTASGRPLDIFRLGGIYGPGRSVLDDLRQGTARRVIRPGHVFNRIHRDDIAGAVLAAIAHPPDGSARVLNLVDDEPAESAAVIEEAARLLGTEAPPGIPFEMASAEMSPMARSFWADHRRVSSKLTQQVLHRTWRFPTYREGLQAILQEEVGNHRAQQGQV